MRYARAQVWEHVGDIGQRDAAGEASRSEREPRAAAAGAELEHARERATAGPRGNPIGRRDSSIVAASATAGAEAAAEVVDIAAAVAAAAAAGDPTDPGAVMAVADAVPDAVEAAVAGEPVGAREGLG
eukprot:85869-Chlamydomonas_euryale.AAC.1